MAPDFAVSGVVKRSLSDIKAGDYIASTSVREPDGKLRALEVHFLPPGADEGQFAWDLAPDSLMTNATVAGVAAAPQGQVLRVTYKGQEAEITVPPDVPVVAFVPGDISLVKPGAADLHLRPAKARWVRVGDPRHPGEGWRQAADVSGTVQPSSTGRGS